MNAKHYLEWKAEQKAKMSDPFQGRTAPVTVPASTTPAPVDGSYPGGSSSPFAMGMQVTPPVPPTTLGGLIPAADVQPSSKPRLPREVSHPETPAERDPAIAQVRDMQAETRNKADIAGLIQSWR